MNRDDIERTLKEIDADTETILNAALKFKSLFEDAADRSQLDVFLKAKQPVEEHVDKARRNREAALLLIEGYRQFLKEDDELNSSKVHF
jgi:hypothetical protein